MHVEFIQAQQAQPALEDGLDHRLDRIGVLVLAPGGLAEGGNPGMHLVHELMKMNPAFLPKGDGGKKQVHQHGLAAPHLAIEIEPAHRHRRLLEKAEQALGFVGEQISQHPIEFPDGINLCRVGRQRAARDQLVIGGTDGGPGCSGAGRHEVIRSLPRARPKGAQGLKSLKKPACKGRLHQKS